MNFRDFALGLISRNPQVANNPQAQNYIQILQSGDNEQAKQVAQNLCATYGVTPEQASTQAKHFFGIPF